MRRGLNDGTERLKGQLRDNRTQERPQDYGSEKIEGSAQRGAALAGRSAEAFLKSGKRKLERGGSRASSEPKRADAPAEHGRQKLIQEKGRAEPSRQRAAENVNAQGGTQMPRDCRGNPNRGETVPRKSQTPAIREKNLSTVNAAKNPKEPQRLKPQDKRELLSNNLRHLTRDNESAYHNTEIGAHPAETSSVQRYGKPRAQTGKSTSPAAVPIRRKIKADAPKIKLPNNTIKQPVRALERAKEKAILDARKSTAAARTTARTAQIGGRAAEGTARELGAAVSRALKASLEGLRALASMIAAGGGVALVVVLVICLVALLLVTPFGLFLAPQHSDSGSIIRTAITSLNGEFSLVIEQIQENNPHDVLNMDNDGVAAVMGNWNDALAIYAVLITTDDIQICCAQVGLITILQSCIMVLLADTTMLR